MYALCHHPEYIPLLREEITREKQYSKADDPFKTMYLLDSFLLEVTRMNPPESLTVQKKVKKPFTLPSGVHVPAGNLVAVPHQARARNPDIFPNPDEFNPRRFLSTEHQREYEAVSKFTDVNYQYLYWGPPKKACPGRWYVAHALKQAVVHLLENYDVKLEKEGDTGVFTWTTVIFPSPTSKILLRKRADSELHRKDSFDLSA
jgi:cytochrome P450